MGRGNKHRLLFGGLALFTALVLGFLYIAPETVNATNTDVVINEIHYNPNTGGNQDFEFLELYNNSGASIDISDWCFTQGISLCFANGTSIEANSFAVVSPDEVVTQTYYIVNVVGVYSGNLSNGGETVTLRDNLNDVVSSVTYDDSGDWPASPDGYGPSLELKDPSLDESLSTSWGANVNAGSFGDGQTSASPNAVNSLFEAGDPVEVSNLNQITDVQDNEAPTVTVESSSATSVNLKYKIAFENDITIAMNDDGEGVDATASDGIWSAQIPAQDPGELIRYRVEATDGGPVGRLPRFDLEAMNYKGYVVRDPSQTADIPIIQWFMPEEDYDELITDHVFDDEYMDCVVAYGDQVFDNSEVKVKGEFSLVFPKKSFKFKLPKTHTIDIPGKTPRSLNEFHMNSEWADQTKAKTLTAWQLATEIGFDTPAYFPTRVLRNNNPQGFYFFFEKYENEYQQDKNMTTGILAEDFHEIMSENGSLNDMEEWKQAMTAKKSPERREYVLDNHDIPNFINFMAFQALINNNDWYAENNLITYKDLAGDGRWRLLPYDLDLVLNNDNSSTAITPYAYPRYVPASTSRFQTTALYDELDLREMYYRRLRTLTDEYYSNNRLLDLYMQNFEELQGEAQADLNLWPITSIEFPGGGGMSSSDQTNNLRNINLVKKMLLARYRFDGAIPEAQSQNPVVEFSAVEPSLNESEQYILLNNQSSEAIDISGWTIPEINYTFPSGSVVPSNSEVYIVRDDLAYKNVHPGTLILDAFTEDLAQQTVLTLERSDNSVSDTIDYVLF